MKIESMSLNQMFNSDQKFDEALEQITNGLNTKYKDFRLNNDGEIIHRPTGRTVIPKQNLIPLLEHLWNDETNLVGKGITAVYKYILARYINITRSEVEQFMKSKSNYSMQMDGMKTINKAIIEKAPNVRWQIDLIDLTAYEKQNRGWKYLLVCADVFSRRIFIARMKNKTAQTTAEALDSVLTRADVKPKYIQTDNGGEFLAEFDDYLRENGIKHILNQSHNPNDNAVVERANKEAQKIMRAFFLKNNNKHWYDIVQQIEDNFNSAYNSTIKHAPNQVWTNTPPPAAGERVRILPAHMVRNASPKLKAQQNLLKRAIRVIDKYKEHDNFQVGQEVRVKMSELFSQVRAKIKAGLNKEIVVSWSPDVFVVSKVMNTRSTLERKRYELVNSDGAIVCNHNHNARYFYASDLQPFTGGEDYADIDVDEALRLNGCQRTRTDAII